MTLTETLLAGGVLGAAMFAATLGTRNVRNELKLAQTREALLLLDAAVGAYHETTGVWPACPMPTPPPQGRFESGDRMVAALAGEPAARAELNKLPVLLTKPASFEKGGPGAPFSSEPAPTTVRDGWGRPLRCLTVDSPASPDRQSVAVNAGRPVFVSAGPDGDFGIDNLAASADNLRSDGR